MCVRRAQLRPNGDHWQPPGEPSPGPFHDVCGQVHPAPAGAAPADVGRPVLANPEDDRPPTCERDEHQHVGVRVRAKHPHDVDVVQGATHLSDRAAERSEHGDGVGEARVVRKRRELDPRREGIAGFGARGREATDQPQPLDMGGDSGEEQRKRALRVDDLANSVINVVRVNGQSHLNSSFDRTGAT